MATANDLSTLSDAGAATGARSGERHQEAYYGEDYYSWQQQKGRFSGLADFVNFKDYIRDTDRVVDFGCGGGFLLSNLRCKEKIGVEINAVARQHCETLGLRCLTSVDEIPDQWADTIISNHALEHVLDPIGILKVLKSKLRPGGKVVFIVPCERIDTKFVANNRDQHLFTWSPLNLGNLFTAAGYSVLESKAVFHRWVPRGHLLQPILGWKAFHAGSRLYGFLFRRLSQVRVVATIA